MSNPSEMVWAVVFGTGRDAIQLVECADGNPRGNEPDITAEFRRAHCVARLLWIRADEGQARGIALTLKYRISECVQKFYDESRERPREKTPNRVSVVDIAEHRKGRMRLGSELLG